MQTNLNKQKINWYRIPIESKILQKLHQRSDFKGLLQALGYLGLLFISGSAVIYAAADKWNIFILLGLIFIHGTFYSFLINGFHELCHRSVFKTRFLNEFFLRILSFLGWYNHVHFWASHSEHHKYTLHPPDDLEVVLPIKLSFKDFLKIAVFNPRIIINRVKTTIRHSRGIIEGKWENIIFPESDQQKRNELFQWARILLLGHGLIIAVSIYFELWFLPIVITFAPSFGGWLFFLCNNTQHVGMQDKVADFRLCCRTIILNSFVRFLYWHMNFHIEHHMYAAVPCYNLGKLHKNIKHELPYCPVGLYATWKEIIPLMQEQSMQPQHDSTESKNEIAPVL